MGAELRVFEGRDMFFISTGMSTKKQGRAFIRQAQDSLFQ